MTVGATGAVLAGVWGLGDGVAILASVAPVIVLVGTDTFGSSELRLLLFQIKRASARFLGNGAGAIRQECRLHGGRDWAGVWDALICSVENGDVQRIEVAIDMPAVGESYHGFWSLSTVSEGLSHWSVVHSVRVRGVHAGELRVSGGVDASRSRYLDKVEELVRILEDRLEAGEPIPQSHTHSGLVGQGMGRVVLPGTDI